MEKETAPKRQGQRSVDTDADMESFQIAETAIEIFQTADTDVDMISITERPEKWLTLHSLETMERGLNHAVFLKENGYLNP